MAHTLLLLPILTLTMPIAFAPATARDPAVERADERHQLQPVRKRERTKPGPTAPCSGCATLPSAHPPMLDAPLPGLLLIPAEAAAF